MRASNAEAGELAMQRRAGNAKVVRRCRHVALGPRKGALNDAARGLCQVFRRSRVPAQDVGRQQRLRQALLRNPQRLASQAVCSDDQVVGIDRNQGTRTFVSHGRQLDARFRKAMRKLSASMFRAASVTAIAMRLANPSVRSARQDDTSSAAAMFPR